jgi:hypothetical protein
MGESPEQQQLQTESGSGSENTTTSVGAIEKQSPVAVPDVDNSSLGRDADADVEAGLSKGEPSSSETDPNMVDWDGSDDPEDPMNWPDSKKWTNISILSLLTVVTWVMGQYAPFATLLC